VRYQVFNQTLLPSILMLMFGSRTGKVKVPVWADLTVFKELAPFD
jgi:hypothetical protein